MMRFLRNRPVDGTVLPIMPASAGLAVRYAGRQPVAFIHAFTALAEQSKARYVLVSADSVPASVLTKALNSGRLVARFGDLSLVDLDGRM
jgi:hypothetical protein